MIVLSRHASDVRQTSRWGGRDSASIVTATPPVVGSGPGMCDHGRRSRTSGAGDREENTMSKRARKRRSRKGKAANHGKKPNA